MKRLLLILLGLFLFTCKPIEVQVVEKHVCQTCVITGAYANGKPINANFDPVKICDESLEHIKLTEPYYNKTIWMSDGGGSYWVRRTCK